MDLSRPAFRRLQLLLTFMKIGLFAFGGGYAMIPLIQKETVERKQWITDDTLLEVVALAESTPGPIAVNAATFIGYRVAGFFGAVCATVGVVFPSFLILLLVSFVLRRFYDLQAVRYAFFGIRAGVLALILKAVWSMFRKNPLTVFSCVLMTLAFAAVAFLNIHALIVIACAAAAGIIYSLAVRGKARGGRSGAAPPEDGGESGKEGGGT